jgi:hypothetical protein
MRLSLPVNVALHEFFAYLDKTENQDDFAPRFIQHMGENYRYKLYNCRDSQANYSGCWVSEVEPLSAFEEMYRSLDDICPYEYDEDSDDMVDSEAYGYATHLLNAYPAEEVDLDTYTI